MDNSNQGISESLESNPKDTTNHPPLKQLQLTDDCLTPSLSDTRAPG